MYVSVQPLDRDSDESLRVRSAGDELFPENPDLYR